MRELEATCCKQRAEKSDGLLCALFTDRDAAVAQSSGGQLQPAGDSDNGAALSRFDRAAGRCSYCCCRQPKTRQRTVYRGALRNCCCSRARVGRMSGRGPVGAWLTKAIRRGLQELLTVAAGGKFKEAPVEPPMRIAATERWGASLES